MAQQSNPDLTQLLQSWSNGDQHALKELTPFVYRELHRLAAHYMSAEETLPVRNSTPPGTETRLVSIDAGTGEASDVATGPGVRLFPAVLASGELAWLRRNAP